MFKLTIKRFIQSPVFLISTFCYIFILCQLQPVHELMTIDDISTKTLTTQPFSFLYFMLISYEFFYQTKSCKLDEVIAASRLGQMREKCYGVCFFMCLNAVLYVIYLFVSMWGTTSLLEEINMEWFWLLVKVFLINHFLVYSFAILIGVLVSLIHTRLKAFGVLVIVYSLFSRIMLPIIMSTVSFSEKWTHRIDIIGIMSHKYFNDLFYCYSTEPVDAQRILFWIFLAVFVFCLLVNKGRWHILTGGVAVAAGVTLVMYMQPSGYRYIGNEWDTFMAEQHYYFQLYEDNKDGIGRTYKEADFNVLKYRGELSAYRILEASVDVTVDEGTLQEYCFTLYHGYEVAHITDGGGRELAFEQDGDHILVKNSSTMPIEKIHFEYAGYSRKYVATSQAVCLGGYFPYLPQPGWNVYMTQPDEDGNWNIDYEFKGLGYKTEFDIRFETEQRVYTNLKEVEPSHYTGISEGATFVASKFMKEMKIGNCTLYYSVLSRPYFKSALQETKKIYENALKSIPGSDDWDDMKIFDVSSIAGSEFMYYFASDHMIADDSKIMQVYPYYREHGETPAGSDLMEGSVGKGENSEEGEKD